MYEEMKKNCGSPYGMEATRLMNNIKFDIIINGAQYSTDAYGEPEISGIHIQQSDLGFEGWIFNYTYLNQLCIRDSFEQILKAFPPCCTSNEELNATVEIKPNDGNPYINGKFIVTIEVRIND